MTCTDKRSLSRFILLPSPASPMPRWTKLVKRSNRISALFILLGAAAVAGGGAAAHAADTAPMLAVNPQTLKFTPIPNMPSCVSAAALRGNPRSGPAWVLLKLASGCRVPTHWHTANEDLVVISGRGSLVMKDAPPLQFVPGAFASLPNHHTHQANCTRSCLLFAIGDAAFDIHYVDAKGEEIPLDQALKLAGKTKTTKK